MSDLTRSRVTRPQVIELLTAISEALDVPIAARYEDDELAAQVQRDRAAYVRGVVLALTSDRGCRLTSATASVRRAAVYHPVTYQPYDSEAAAARRYREGQLAEQRHQLLDDDFALTVVTA